jgi:Protein of unknown function (DUF1566)
MKRTLSRVAGVTVLAIWSITSTALAQTTAPGPYYATPSWDQTLPSSTRFIVLSNMANAAVLDRETGLVWQRTPGFEVSFGLVSSQCRNLNVGNRFGWRLPTQAELASLFDPSATSAPGLPPGHPFLGLDAAEEVFWTTTPSIVNPTHFLTVAYGLFPPNNTFRVTMSTSSPPESSNRGWCVRGGIGIFSGAQ